MNSIPASALVAVTPSVISAGGDALDLSGLVLTTNTTLPTGVVQSFPSAPSVAAFFGPTSVEATLASVYFGGFTNSTRKPGAMLFAQFQPVDTAAYLRSGPLAGVPLSLLQTFSGSLSVTVDGAVKSAASVDLSTASSYSGAAAIIAGALGISVSFDSVTGALIAHSGSTGSASSMSYATGALADLLLMTQATGAVTSAGAQASSPAAAMLAITNQTQDWASFTTAFQADVATRLGFAAWTNATNNRYLYVPWDQDAADTAIGGGVSFGAQVLSSQYSGVAPVYSGADIAVFILGAIASIDFTRRRGRASLAFRYQTGLSATVTDQATSETLRAQGYNWYGAYATANERFVCLQPGRVSGPFSWIDSYVNQIWLTNALQLSLMTLLLEETSIPYNVQGYASIQAACLDPINQAVLFGAIQPGVTLSQLQIDEVNAAAGQAIDGVLSTRGWFLVIQPALPQTRALRQSPPCTLFYMDGESVQSISLASILIQ